MKRTDETVHRLQWLRSPAGAAALIDPARGGTVHRLRLCPLSPDTDSAVDAPVDILWGDPEPARSPVETDLFRGRPLVPFADRIPGGSYTFQGATCRLPINDTTMGDAIHGFLYRTALAVVDGGKGPDVPEGARRRRNDAGGGDPVGDLRVIGDEDEPVGDPGVIGDEDEPVGDPGVINHEDDPAGPERSITLEGDIPPQPGYPWRLGVRLRYILRDTKFVYRIRVTNKSEEVAPITVGWHPYFVAPGLGAGEPIDVATLHVASGEYLEVDERLRPTGDRRKVDGTAIDYRVARPIGHDEIDIGLAESTRATLAGPTGRIEIETGGAFAMIQLFVPPTREAIAIEPFSAPGAAFQRPELGLTTLVPGGSIDAWAVITLRGTTYPPAEG
ncbi:MAG: aldose 1-epimerase [Alkalispirochaeta sp.]